MRALIMAGGEGRRLNLGEKPLILVNGQPMIGYVVEAFSSAGCEPVVATSPKTPMTTNWCRVKGIDFCKCEGHGYIDDMVYAVSELDEEEPLFVSVSDIPGIIPENVRFIRETYTSEGSDALSVWVPATLVKSGNNGMPYRIPISGIDACPVGVNILRGDKIASVQEEFALLLDDPALALNVNTRDDLITAEHFLKERSVQKVR
jgi:adenosylcobinamide-phosphate guanylyltransferase